MHQEKKIYREEDKTLQTYAVIECLLKRRHVENSLLQLRLT
jgi:hypothetical protein